MPTHPPLDHPQPLAALVAYQDGAIVSRVLLKTAGGSVTVFAFDTGQELSEHTAPFDALVQVLDGEAEITVAGVVHRVPAGEALRLPANRPHALRAVTRFTMQLTMVRA